MVVLASKKSALQQWVTRLSDQEMPVFAHTARQLAGMSTDHDTSAADLAQIILQDTSMTARLLRMANSTHYNPAGNAVSTVSRAVVLLGFDAVRALCLSIAMVDTLLSGVQRDRALAELARSFHAAVQAKAFAAERGDPSPEEVFIASLLYRLGHMAFWCFSGPEAERLDEILKETDIKEQEAERMALGFSLTELSAALNEEWRLSELLTSALVRGNSTEPRVSNIILGHDLACLAPKGWNHQEVKALTQRIADTLYLSVDDTKQLIYHNARVAAEAALAFGAAAAGRLIPSPPSDGYGAEDEEFIHDIESQTNRLSGPLLQLQILRELSALLSGKVDLNALVSLVLEGVLRGIGMDRTLFALLTPDRRSIAAKYALGLDRQKLISCFRFQLGSKSPSVLDEVIAGRIAYWAASRPEITGAANASLIDCIGRGDFFLMPVFIEDNPVGMFYADRRPSGHVLEEDAFLSFRHFCEQATLGLSLASKAGRVAR